MIKKIISILLVTLLLFLFIGCKQQPTVPESAKTPVAGTPTEDPVAEVGTGISDISNADKDLDSSELDDLDTVLEDISNI